MTRWTWLGLGAVLLGCPPHRDYSLAQIESAKSLAEVMDVQATVADPQFKKIDQGAYTDQDWAAFADMGNRLQATSSKIKQFSKGPEFDQLADRLHSHAEKLSAVAGAKDARGASETIASIKATCKECHSKLK